jgi:hypothetical protein
MARAAALVAALAALVASADSPLTSIDFTPSYADLPSVIDAKAKQILTPQTLDFLLSDAPNDQKAATINALGWTGNGNAAVFLKGLLSRRHLESIELNAMSASDAFVLGYLRAMDDYLELTPVKPGGKGVAGRRPIELLEYAVIRLPSDFAVHYVTAMVRAQKTMANASKWCEVFTGPQRVLQQFPPASRNLKPGAVEAAIGYLKMYEESCPTSKAGLAKAREELNQIYAVVRLGTQIVTGTQGGVVVWDPETKRRVATQEEFICNRVVVFNGAAWAGCDKHVYRWDGKAFKAYLANKFDDAEYYAPMLGPGGVLWVRYRDKLYVYEPSGDTFNMIRSPWPGDPYDVFVTRMGEVWWIDFLNSIHTAKKTWQLKTTEYPGRDPRRFREDATGALWVEDFESGAFRLGGEGTFVREPGVESQVTGVAFDLSHELLFLLQYRKGLVLRQNGRTVQTVDLHELDYMRDLMIEPTGDIWVGGWNQLLRLREQEGRWVKDSFRAE